MADKIWTVEIPADRRKVEGYDDVVSVLLWTCKASAPHGGSVAVAEHAGSEVLPPPEGADFIPLDDLTQDQLVAWVKASIRARPQRMRGNKPVETDPVLDIEAAVEAELDEKLAVPWLDPARRLPNDKPIEG